MPYPYPANSSCVYFCVTVLFITVTVVTSEINYITLNGDYPFGGQLQLHVYDNNERWYMYVVCPDGWNMRNAEVVCRELGYETGAMFFDSSPIDQPIDFFPAKFHCHGDEMHLMDCPQDAWSGNCPNNLRHKEHVQVQVGVRCNSPGYLGCYQLTDEMVRFSVEIPCTGSGSSSRGRRGGRSSSSSEEDCSPPTLTECFKYCHPYQYAAMSEENNCLCWEDTTVFQNMMGSIQRLSNERCDRPCEGDDDEMTICGGSNNTASVYRRNMTRLHGGDHPFEGQLQVLIDNKWHVVCSHGWNLINTEVVCRELGYENGASMFFASISIPSGPRRRQPDFVMSDFSCYGNEQRLMECKLNSWSGSCPYPEGRPRGEVGIRCNSSTGTQDGTNSMEPEGFLIWPTGDGSEDPSWQISTDSEANIRKGVRFYFISIQIRWGDQLQIIEDDDVSNAFVVNQSLEGRHKYWNTTKLTVRLETNYRDTQHSVPWEPIDQPSRKRRSSHVSRSMFYIKYTIVAKCNPPTEETFKPSLSIYYQGNNVIVRHECGTSNITSIITCNEDGNWSELPTCQDPSSTEKPEISSSSTTMVGDVVDTTTQYGSRTSPSVTDKPEPQSTSSEVSNVAGATTEAGGSNDYSKPTEMASTSKLGYGGDTAARSGSSSNAGTIAGAVRAVFLVIAVIIILVIIYLLRKGKIGKDSENGELWFCLKKSPHTKDADQTRVDNPVYSPTETSEYAEIGVKPLVMEESVNYYDIGGNPTVTNNPENDGQDNPTSLHNGVYDNIVKPPSRPNISSANPENDAQGLGNPTSLQNGIYDNTISTTEPKYHVLEPQAQSNITDDEKVDGGTPGANAGTGTGQEAEYHVLEQTADDDDTDDVDEGGNAAPEYYVLERDESTDQPPRSNSGNIKHNSADMDDQNDEAEYYVLEKEDDTSGGEVGGRGNPSVAASNPTEPEYNVLDNESANEDSVRRERDLEPAEYEEIPNKAGEGFVHNIAYESSDDWK